jgi:hypothetical protein
VQNKFFPVTPVNYSLFPLFAHFITATALIIATMMMMMMMMELTNNANLSAKIHKCIKVL